MGLCAVYIWKLFTVSVGFMILRLDREPREAGEEQLRALPSPQPPALNQPSEPNLLLGPRAGCLVALIQTIMGSRSRVQISKPILLPTRQLADPGTCLRVTAFWPGPLGRRVPRTIWMGPL